MTALVDITDEARVAEIGDYQVLLRPPRSDLQALVEVAAQVARVPMATINLVTDTEQHQVAAYGFDAAVCSREDSMCNLVLHVGHPVIVPDASEDERFRHNPFVTGVIGNVRFYATHQLVTPKGVVIGTLCVFDEEPRTLGLDQERALASLAERVVDLLELELRTRELSATVDQLSEA
ncbi:MAG: GAF domain-containing protein, partial [Nocardioides sp.]